MRRSFTALRLRHRRRGFATATQASSKGPDWLGYGLLGGVAIACGGLVHHVFIDFPEPCARSFETASESHKLEETFGAPLSRNYLDLWTGRINEKMASVKIPVRGPAASGMLHAKSILAQDEWKVIQLCAEIDGKIVDMLWQKAKDSEVDEALGFNFGLDENTQRYLQSYQQARDSQQATAAEEAGVTVSEKPS